MQFSMILHRYSKVSPVKVFNNKDWSFRKQQINARIRLTNAFICGIGYQCFALTNPYVISFLLFYPAGFYYTYQQEKYW